MEDFKTTLNRIKSALSFSNEIIRKYPTREEDEDNQKKIKHAERPGDLDQVSLRIQKDMKSNTSS